MLVEGGILARYNYSFQDEARSAKKRKFLKSTELSAFPKNARVTANPNATFLSTSSSPDKNAVQITRNLVYLS
jgi:hypothetical protein